MVRLAASIVAAALLAFGLPTGAAAAPKKIVTHSPDSLAPRGAPAHWLPPEPWVYNHWLPYDETRLYSVLGITRSELWQQLRDDKRTLAQLAAKHGWKDPKKLAAKLVAPRAESVGSERLAELQSRAERTITQGHLAQHLFFHSLHQFALPSAAPELFGVTDRRFRELRRAELSPLAIARLHGLSPGEVEAQAIAVLRDRLDAGVTSGAMSSKQAKILERRQLSQLPRWLDQQRYNGPPLTKSGALLAKPRDYASNPVISGDGMSVAYEAYRQKLPLALKFGEIAVLRANLVSGSTDLVSTVQAPDASGPRPASSYNPSISGDGARVVYENSAGNQNFGKRYGRIGVLICDLSSASHTAEVDAAEAGPAESDSQSAYNPVVSGDGRSVAYQAISSGRASILVQSPGGVRSAFSGRKVGGSVFADPFEPGISADGSRVVFTRTSGVVGDAASGGSTVEVQNLATGKRVLVSRAGGSSSDPAISSDGRYVVFTERTNVYLRDVDGARTSRIPTSKGVALDPVVSNGGRVAAYTDVTGSNSRVVVWDSASGVTRRIPVAQASDASISDDGTKVAFTSTVSGVRAVYLWDAGTGKTRTISDPAKAYEVGQ